MALKPTIRTPVPKPTRANETIYVVTNSTQRLLLEELSFKKNTN
jgi:hypothetical protein